MYSLLLIYLTFYKFILEKVIDFYYSLRQLLINKKFILMNLSIKVKNKNKKT
jgi:hypothetical protein